MTSLRTMGSLLLVGLGLGFVVACGGTAEGEDGSGGSSSGGTTSSGGTSGSGTSCEYEGTTYEDGAAVPADPCNKCFCSAGNIECTTMDCVETTCGGFAGATCAETEFCSYELDALCGGGDMTGTCVVRPTACDANYAPVCGCDGETYPNECAANAAGTSAASEGACPVE